MAPIRKINVPAGPRECPVIENPQKASFAKEWLNIGLEDMRDADPL